MPETYKIAEAVSSLAFNAEGIAEIEVGGRKICVYKRGRELYACRAACPHAGHPLAEGYVDAKLNIVCPLHSYKFSLESGKNVTGEGYDLKLYKVEQRPDGVFISF